MLHVLLGTITTFSPLSSDEEQSERKQLLIWMNSASPKIPSTLGMNIP